jgi:hypothetical protein
MVDACIGHLVDRAGKLIALLKANVPLFPKVNPAQWAQL